MLVKIGSTIFEIIKFYKTPTSYTFRVSKDISDSFNESLSETNNLTMQDEDTSIVVSDYETEGFVIWDNFIDFTVSTKIEETIITKAQLDLLNEQITNLELALCELYEKQEA